MTNQLISAALRYAENGWPVFPCNREKKPLTAHGFKDATTDPEQIKKWWQRWPDAAVATPTGPRPKGCGAWVLDVDLPDGPASLAALEEEHGPLPTTVEQKTGSGGRQLFFAWPEHGEVKNTARKLGPGLDTRGAGGYVILPPSRNTRGRYEWK